MATPKKLEANKRHLDKMHRFVFYRKLEERDMLERRLREKGFPSMNAYVNSLINQDMGISDTGEENEQ